jgi:hypothetical protein
MKLKSQIVLLLAFTGWIIANSSCHKIPEDYLLGEWHTTDSATGETDMVVFQKNKTLVFENPRSEWIYSYKMEDSIIDLDYIMYLENMTLENGGILLVQNDNCFWWFSEQTYEVYQRRLGMNHHVTMPDKFQLWLKENRKVFYRVKK